MPIPFFQYNLVKIYSDGAVAHGLDNTVSLSYSVHLACVANYCRRSVGAAASTGSSRLQFRGIDPLQISCCHKLVIFGEKIHERRSLPYSCQYTEPDGKGGSHSPVCEVADYPAIVTFYPEKSLEWKSKYIIVSTTLRFNHFN